MSRKKKTLSVADAIRRRRINLSVNQGYRILFVKIMLLLACGWVILSEVFLITLAEGNGMFPAIKDGDVILSFRLQEEYLKDDVIVFSVDSKEYIGRIIARESDVVTLDDGGTLLVNGTAQSGEIMYPTYAKDGMEYPYVVPENHVFVLGDYRTQTTDSRDFGAVSLEDVEGKIITILRRRGL